MGLQIQEATLRTFFEKSGDLARGTGFLARFLVSWPGSTQGSRFYTDPPEDWHTLEAFNKRITEILEADVSIDDDGGLSLIKRRLSTTAKTAWVAFHDEIEFELGKDGKFHEVRDVASKVADNAVRLAGLFQVFENDNTETITVEFFKMASKIALWHLYEAIRFYGELALPEETRKAAILDEWLLDYCRKNGVNKIKKRTIQQLGPNALRRKDSLDGALKELEELDRLQVGKEGKSKLISFNPKLLS